MTRLRAEALQRAGTDSADLRGYQKTGETGFPLEKIRVNPFNQILSVFYSGF
jgi:hypothetical protein